MNSLRMFTRHALVSRQAGNIRIYKNHPSSALSLDVIVGCLLGKYDKFHQHLHQNNKDSCISSSVWKAINVSYINPLLLYLSRKKNPSYRVTALCLLYNQAILLILALYLPKRKIRGAFLLHKYQHHLWVYVHASYRAKNSHTQNTIFWRILLHIAMQ